MFKKIKSGELRAIYLFGIKLFSYKSDINKDKKHFKKFGYELSAEDSKYVIKGKKFTIKGNSPNTIYICGEVLCKDEYNFEQNEKYVLFDIGQNIAITSILKATDEKCVHVYGFEPFTETFNQGQDNVSTNGLNHKITSFNFGLSNKNKTLEISYNLERIGSMSSVKDIFPGNKKAEIEIKNASEILKPLFEKHNEKIVLKIDCEGAEFEILEDLHKNEMLKKVSCLMIEWHYKNPERIVEILKQNSFSVFCTSEINSEIGFIRAVK